MSEQSTTEPNKTTDQKCPTCGAYSHAKPPFFGCEVQPGAQDRTALRASGRAIQIPSLGGASWRTIGRMESPEQAAQAVRAVNSHEALVAALGYVPEQIDLNTARYKEADDSDTVTIEVTVGWLRECRDALAAAR